MTFAQYGIVIFSAFTHHSYFILMIIIIVIIIVIIIIVFSANQYNDPAKRIKQMNVLQPQ
jgi:uncharacterized membrane protein YjdF